MTALAERPAFVPVARRRSIAELLATARARIDRLDPFATAQVLRRGGLLVDIRPEAQRRAEGEIPGSLVIERNVLEWRLDPTSEARIPEAVGYDVEVVVICSEGYTSSLAAAALRDVGLHRAADLAGGFAAWQAAGLPTVDGGTAAGARVRASDTDPLDIAVDRDGWSVHVAGQPVEVTRFELLLLAELQAARGRVLTRERLRAALADAVGPQGASARSIDVHVYRLRRKLGPAGVRLVTVRGVGLKLLPRSAVRAS